MSLNTILLNKFGMLDGRARNEPRDIDDIWFLLNRTSQFDFDFNHVRRIFKIQYGRSLLMNNIMSNLKKESLKINWEMWLSQQVA